MPSNTEINKSVIILGDSTSMTVGVCQESYPFHLASFENWAENTTFINCSQPGFTAADASAFFFNEACKKYNPKAVIIYLGNCDANATEFRKGTYHFTKQYSHRVRNIFLKNTQPRKLTNKLLRDEWNDQYDSSIEKPETPESFEKNIERIMKACGESHISVLLVKPLANRNFPAGVGKGNFLFYSYLNVSDREGAKLKIEDKRYNRARIHEVKEQWKEAAEIYTDILNSPPANFGNLEYPLIVVNNYAVCKAKSGGGAEAEILWLMLLKEPRFIRKEIVMYNLACHYSEVGDIQSSEKYFEMAYEQDGSLYRIKKEYREAIDRLTGKFPNARLVDMSGIFLPESYVDHCHLIDRKQRFLAKLVKDTLETNSEIRGKKKAGIKNILFNPELALGNTSEFFSYYKTFAPYTETQISEQLDNLKEIDKSLLTSRDSSIPGVSGEMLRAIGYYLAHPAFSQYEDILLFPPLFPEDIGRFPEFYLIRQMIPYISYLENNRQLLDEFIKYRGIWHPSSKLFELLPDGQAKQAITKCKSIGVDNDVERAKRITENVRAVLLAHLKKGPQVCERLKTTIFWYFRELLRWGPHSRISMRYDRRVLEYCMEALIVSAAILDNIQMNSSEENLLLAKITNDIVTTHEYWCDKYSVVNVNEQLLYDYKYSLDKIIGDLEN